MTITDRDRTAVSRISTVLLWLFVINLGSAFGAGLYESRIVVPERAESSPQSLSTALQWVQLNHLRHVVVFVAFMAALRTFSLLYACEPQAPDVSGRK